MAKFVAYTRREELAKLSFEWNISEFGEKIKTAKTGEAVKLDTVHVGETKWLFEVFPNGENSSNVEGSVSLFCESQDETEKTAKISINIMDRNGQNINRDNYNSFQMTNTFKESIGTDNFISHEEFNDHVSLLSDGNLRLFITIMVLGDEKTTRTPTQYDFQEIGSIEVKEKLKAIEHIKDGWADKDFSDVTIKCKGEIFYCHRMILARRSQYFRGMLESGLEESKMQIINFDHMDVHVLKAILKFIYGGEIDNLELNAASLLLASNMFILEDLKDICEKYLAAKYMKLDNVINVLIMADSHNANYLKKGAMEMIVANRDAIVKQVGWEEKLIDKPKLLLEIFKATTSKSDQ